MSQKPDYGFWKLWNLSFGFFGVQIAYALQSAQVSRIFSTIGADPHDLSYFWILPPLMGLLVQPIVGSASDRTWNRFGRRLPYLLFGATIAIIVMCLLPNAGSLNFTVQSAIIFGLIMLMFLDTSINMAMQPFKMLVGDFVNERQKSKAYAIQSFLCNAGSVVGYVAPFILALFLAKTAPEGEVPPTVTWSFYLGAIILALCVIYSFVKIKEMPPAEYAAYHGLTDQGKDKKEKKENIFKLLVKAPKVFWTIGLVQFFCWAAFLWMWTYSTDAIANQVFNAPAVERVTGVSINGVKYEDKYLFNANTPIIEDGHLTLAGIEVDGQLVTPLSVKYNGKPLIENGKIATVDGAAVASSHNDTIAVAGQVLIVDGREVAVEKQAITRSNLSLVTPGDHLTLAHIAKLNKDTKLYELEQTSDVPGANPADIDILTTTVLNSASEEYQEAGDWNGVLLAIQGIAAVLWSIVLSQIRRRKLAYSLSLLLGAVGFASVLFFTNKYAIGISYALMGCAWAAILAMPFTILTNALSGNHIGTYLGLFNCTICIPQIIAALCGGVVLSMVPLTANGVPNTIYMLVGSGILLALGSLAVWNIRETFGSKTAEPVTQVVENEI